MASKKQRQKEEQEELKQLLAPDAFLEHGEGTVQWFEKHGMKVLVAAGAILVLVLVGQIWRDSAIRGEGEMTGQLVEAIESYRGATDLQKVLTATVAGQSERDYREAETQLADFRSRYTGSSASVIASVYQADLLRRLGKLDEARALFDAYLSQVKNSFKDPLWSQALVGAAATAEDLKDYPAARAYFERLAEASAFRVDALQNQARLFEAEGKPEEAKKLYKQVIESAEAGSIHARLAEQRLGILE